MHGRAGEADAGTPRLYVDPREDVVLPPWLWLTISTICLICLLFISFRRGRALGLEAYYRVRDYLSTHLPFLSLQHGIRLSEADLEANSPASLPNRRRRTRTQTRHRSSSSASADSSDSDSSSLHSDADELPASSPSVHTFGFATPSSTSRLNGTHLATSAAGKLQRGVGNVLASLGWGAANGPTTPATSRNGEKTAGIGRMFWGVRKQDRIRGIRLGDGGYEAADGDAEEDDELSVVGGTISRIFDVAGGGIGGAEPSRLPQGETGGTGGTHQHSTSTSNNTSRAALFDIGTDGEVGVAVELPAQFSFSSPSSSGGNASSRWA
ncbi:hypothetical protein JCM11641_000482 [Rhodosporidiobolus odoratus]